MAMDIHWKEYDGLGHWYSKDMLHDLVVFVREKSSRVVEEVAVNSGIGDER